ncbi:NADH-quinone oxidoreductase subunit NuoE [Aureimonas mangrovi]|uniref:NADH-quinone oxidoreductase subunit NuoE n=1 Tax=Aureimonas mangrovi TaxID=2758041 RepID=UPI00163D5F56|nr:NADH-quinone oxidoreductase subunit NuoE [Aureimonas mangrovi]
MSVRRLADDSVQPATFAFTSVNEGWAEKTVAKYPAGRQQSAVIPLLMRAQEQDGWVTRAAIEHVAERLAMPLIRVLEVATFYTQFQLAPVGRKAHIQVCGTTPCMLRGSDELKAVCARRIHPQPFHLNESGSLSWEEVECLGACVNAPMVMVFKDTYEDLTPERLEEIIDAFERGEHVEPGPQIDRHLSVPFGGPTTLTQVDEDGAAEGGGPANGAATQSGAGEAVDVAPSEAARVDTHAEETDPSLKGPGEKAGVTASPAAEEATSSDPDAGASVGTGTTGGTEMGPTGAAEKDAQADEAAKKGGAANQGDLPTREARDEAAVVDDKRRVKDDAGTAKATKPAAKAPTRRKTSAAADTAEASDAGADKAAAKAKPRRTTKKPADDSDGSKGA